MCKSQKRVDESETNQYSQISNHRNSLIADETSVHLSTKRTNTNFNSMIDFYSIHHASRVGYSLDPHALVYKEGLLVAQHHAEVQSIALMM